MIEQKIHQFEDKLRDKFKPVTPDDDFILRLKNRLEKKAEVYLEPKNFSFIGWIFFIGIVFGLIVYWLFTYLLRPKS